MSREITSVRYTHRGDTVTNRYVLRDDGRTEEHVTMEFTPRIELERGAHPEGRAWPTKTTR